MKRLVQYFSKNHILANFIMLGIILGGIFAWFTMNKEEMPDITLDRVMISTRYSGASCHDIEYFITKPIEDVLRGLDGIYRITSNSSQGRSSITVELKSNYPNRETVLTDIKSYVQDVKFNVLLDDDPVVREYKTSRKAIIDIGIYYEDKGLLNKDERLKLQVYIANLETKLISLPSVSELSYSGYTNKEIQVILKKEKLKQYEISATDVYNVLRQHNLRVPIGTIKGNGADIKITLQDELNRKEKIENLIVQGGFDQKFIYLKDIAEVRVDFEDISQISKINGSEGVILNVRKNSSYGIIEALEHVKKVVNSYKDSVKIEDENLRIVFLDDESRDIKNRISLITKNGIIGFILILICLFLFLNARCALWVALGIPFSFCFTLVLSYFLGFSINNITLAAIIIVMGMIVDDAIVVAENVTRLEYEGVPRSKAVVDGTMYVFLPVIASIVTTWLSFVPLFFFSGMMGKLVAFIPPIIILMLLGSLIESLFILPSHLSIERKKKHKKLISFSNTNHKTHWFERVENKYAKLLVKGLKYKYIIFVFFILLFIYASFIVMKKMKFVMFPREETTQVRLTAVLDDHVKKYETARSLKPVETMLKKYLGKEMVGFRTNIARSRRGRAAKENEANLRIEILQKSERKKSLKELMKVWNQEIKGIKGFKRLFFSKSRFGHSSGSAIEIMIKENDDLVRENAVKKLFEIMKQDKNLKNVEIEKEYEDTEFKITLKRELINRLSIDPSSIATTLRAVTNGVNAYSFIEDEEEIYVVVKFSEKEVKNIDDILNIGVKNSSGYLVPLKKIINLKEVKTPNIIKRTDFMRTTSLFADIDEKSQMSPLEIADYYETEKFPMIDSLFPSISISFEGEVKDSREAGSNFKYAILLALVLIYFVLALLFRSMFKPFIIMLTIPFGIVGIILAFYFHGITLYGFFTLIGALGLSGVVVNDSIIMLVKLEKEYGKIHFGRHPIRMISNISKTRLRAVLLTTVTTVAGLMPTAYGIGGYDSMLAEMMLAMSWGLVFGTCITLFLIPAVYSTIIDLKEYAKKFKRRVCEN